MKKKCLRCGKVRVIHDQGLCLSCYKRERANYNKKKSYQSKKNQFNKINKNYVRRKLIEIIKLKDINEILTLESADFLFAKELLNKRVFVFEYADKEFKQMKKTKPQNVTLFYGDISQAKSIANKFECIYLDFCYGVDQGIMTIANLKDKILESKLFGVTFCLRGFIPEECDYQFEIQKKLYEILGEPLIPLYGYTYRDNHRKGAVMMTMLFEMKCKEAKIKDGYS